jgi:hypothetical protein
MTVSESMICKSGPGAAATGFSSSFFFLLFWAEAISTDEIVNKAARIRTVPLNSNFMGGSPPVNAENKTPRGIASAKCADLAERQATQQLRKSRHEYYGNA